VVQHVWSGCSVFGPKVSESARTGGGAATLAIKCAPWRHVAAYLSAIRFSVWAMGNKVGRKLPGVREMMTSYKTTLFAVVVVVAGLLVVWASDISGLENHLTIQTIMNQIGGYLITTGVLATLWDLVAKRSLIDEVLEKAQVPPDVIKAGVDGLTTDMKEVPWAKLFSRATSVELFVAYGSTWRKSNWSALAEFVATANNKLSVYLPDPEHGNTMAALAERFGYSEDKVKGEIADAVKDYSSLQKGKDSTVTLYRRKGQPMYTAYLFDKKTIVVSLYANSTGRSATPILYLGKGTYLNFFVDDLNKVATGSTEVNTEAEKKVLEEAAKVVQEANPHTPESGGSQ
jgi:hypothetical protein